MRILYIDIDSLRSDHLGCYGYHRNTSPAIDAVAAEGLVCERVYASDAPCLPSRTAFYSGRFGIQTGVVGHGGTTAQPKVEGTTRDFCDTFDSHGLAGKLQKLGYHTAMVSPFGQRHAAWHFYAGFNEIHNTGMYGNDPAEVVQPVVDRWLANNADSDNWFLHINFWDPHGPYRTPAEYGEPFADAPLPEWITDEQMHRMTRNASDAVDPLWTVVREGGPYHARLTTPGHPVGGIEGFKDYLERLKNTGRGDFARKLGEKYLT